MCVSQEKSVMVEVDFLWSREANMLLKALRGIFCLVVK